MRKKQIWAMVISIIMTMGLAMPVSAEEAVEQGKINTASVTEVSDYLMNGTPEKIVSELNMNYVPDWQFGGSGTSYGRNNFFVSWHEYPGADTCISVKCAGNPSISMYGISCGTTRQEVNRIMKREGWYPATYSQERRSATYIKETESKLYMMETTFNAGGNVQEWYWNNWPQGDFWVFPFPDVSRDSWFYDTVMYVNNHWIMTGLENGRFGPEENLARAQFAVILYRMNDEPEVTYNPKFPDVPDGQWYTNAILWASSIGVVNGYSNTGMFGTGDNLNREQMAVMMYRYAQHQNYDISQKTDFSGFMDAASVNEFAKEAMQWAVGSGIITGRDGGTRIDPQGNANRAECATIITRFMEKYL